MVDKHVLDVIEALARADKLEGGQALLREAMKRFGFDHLAYAAVNLPTRRNNGQLIAVSYAPEWRKHYVQSNYVNIDPIVTAGLAGVLPFKWSDLATGDPVVRKFFGEAKEFEIGGQGLSVPIRGRHREFAMLSLSTGERDPRHGKLIDERLGDLMLLAYHFHAWALGVEGMEQADLRDALSQREKECLRWFAAGKSRTETGMILGISDETVKFHLAVARGKLNASNTTHAVAIAIRLGLIIVD